MDDADLLRQNLIEGNLIQMTDKIMQVLGSKYLIRLIHYEGLQRKEPLEIPEVNWTEKSWHFGESIAKVYIIQFKSIAVEPEITCNLE